MATYDEAVPIEPRTTRPICVLGMSRSGTSFATRLIGLLGVDLGSERTMLDRAPDNPRGFWEQSAMVEIDDDLLEGFGGTWWQPPELPAGWQLDPSLDAMRERAQVTVRNHFGESRRYAWKDPRACLTLPFWQAVIGAMDYVVCFRNPLDVAASLARRNPDVHTFEDSLELWLRHSADALRHSGGGRRLVLFYEDWFSEGADDQMARLVDFVLGEGAAVPDGFWDETRAYRDDGLRHHAHSDADLARDSRVSAELRLFWAALRSTRGAPEILDLLPELEDGRSQRRQLLADRESMGDELRKAGDTIDQLEVERGRLAAEVEGLEAAIERERGYRQAVETSASWRLTAPLRTLKRIVQGRSS